MVSAALDSHDGREIRIYFNPGYGLMVRSLSVTCLRLLTGWKLLGTGTGTDGLAGHLRG